LDVLQALGNEGLHVQSMGEGNDSKSFINNIPEPSTALFIGFIGMAAKGCRKIFRVV
jgi:hypothetical protein